MSLIASHNDFVVSEPLISSSTLNMYNVIMPTSAWEVLFGILHG